jgi:mycothiol S-conjugate amidase
MSCSAAYGVRRPRTAAPPAARRIPSSDSVGPMEDLCLLSVHAHPDDESSKGAATVARYHAEGVHTVLVTCTGGEEGDILNPAMESPEVRADIGSVRMRELDAAIAVIGYDELVLLGYRDSGMPDLPSNLHAECFAQADLDEAVGRLVAVIRRTRPQVILTYGEDQRGYRHPDHLRVHEISLLAFDAAGDPVAYPELGEPFQPLKLYYNAWSRELFLERHEKFLELGLESPYEERIAKGWLERRAEEVAPTTRIDVTGFADVRRRALIAHATQIDPNSRNWFGLPDEVEKTMHQYDSYVLARSRTGSTDVQEDDLFAGIRDLDSR